jgi:hypothetical protein
LAMVEDIVNSQCHICPDTLHQSPIHGLHQVWGN